MQLGGHHPTHETREGVDLVEPSAPEARDLRFGDRDPTEKCERDNHERINQTAYKTARCEHREHLAHGHGEQLRDEDHEELIAGARGAVVEAGEVVDRDEEAEGAEEGVGHFGANEGEDEGELAVGFAGGFAVEDKAGEVDHGFDLGEDCGGSLV